jgi:hypothetical protein
MSVLSDPQTGEKLRGQKLGQTQDGLLSVWDKFHKIFLLGTDL